MRLTIGNALLGEYPGEEIPGGAPIGGLRASGTGETQTARGACGGSARLRDRGGRMARLTLPTVRTFESVSEAQRFVLETAREGGVEGPLRAELEDGSEVVYPWAVARPSELLHQGVMVRARWDIEAGERLL
jgi:hypothetical protein